jgi:membrane associated rhomboid family serine protease
VVPSVALLGLATLAGFIVVSVLPEGLGALALVPAELGQRPWSALTYSFVHTRPLPLVLDLAALLLLASRLEGRVGGAGVVGYYAAGAAAGVLLALVQPSVPTAGAGAAIVGLLVGFARHCADELVLPPLPVKGPWPAAALAVAALLPGVTDTPSGVGRGLLLGGLVAGLLASSRPRKRPPERRVEPPNSHFNPPGVRHDVSTPWDSVDLESLHEVNRAVVETLLQRARALGPSHLSPADRDLLDRLTAASRGAGGSDSRRRAPG